MDTSIRAALSAIRSHINKGNIVARDAGFASSGDYNVPKHANLSGTEKSLSKALGFEVLGSGAMGVVCKTPTVPGKVFKLSLSCTDGYRDYIEFVENFDEDAEAAKHLPVVFHSETYCGVFIVVLEELDCGGEAVEEVEHGASIRRALKGWNSESYVPGEEAAKRLYGKLYSALCRIGKNQDMHNGNFAVRPGTDCVVITDPWV